MPELETITIEMNPDEAIAVAMCIHAAVMNTIMPQRMKDALRSFCEKNMAAIEAQCETNWDNWMGEMND